MTGNDQKVAIITGGSQGIGASLVAAYYTAEDYALVTGVNLSGFFWLTQRVIAEMLTRYGGHVVNISATLAKRCPVRWTTGRADAPRERTQRRRGCNSPPAPARRASWRFRPESNQAAILRGDGGKSVAGSTVGGERFELPQPKPLVYSQLVSPMNSPPLG